MIVCVIKWVALIVGGLVALGLGVAVGAMVSAVIVMNLRGEREVREIVDDETTESHEA